MQAHDPRPWERYLQFESGSSQLGIRPIVFQEYELSNPSGPVVERSMLTPSEIALLFMLVKDCYAGLGEIVDLGPLLGVGTNALARGLVKNVAAVSKVKRIHSFDLFLAKGMGTVVTERARSGSVLDRFLRNNIDYLPQISVSAGDFLAMTWDRSAVEILFIDIAKSWELNTPVIRECFPCLIPDRSIVIQQDYVHFGEYWLPIAMEFFGDCFDHLYFVDGATSVYRCRKEIPKHLIYRDIEAMPLGDKLAYLESARAKAPRSVGEILKCSQVQCLIDHDRFEEARALLNDVDLSPVPERLGIADFRSAIPSNARAVNDQLRRRSGKSVASIDASSSGDVEPGGFKADLRVELERTVVGSKEMLSGEVLIRNLGNNTWPLGGGTVGVVNLGAHLWDRDGGEMINHDFMRRRLGEPPRTSVTTGEEARFSITFQPPIYGRYVLEFDLVCEMVCWFEQNGSRTVRVPITVT